MRGGYGLGVDSTPLPVPKIYVRNLRADPLGMLERVVAAVVCAGALAGLVVAAMLRPDPSGMGTHEQLGMAPCGWIRMYNVPCPACGMTTSYAHFARGSVFSAVIVQPAGAMLALLTAVSFWVGGYIAVTGKPVFSLMRGVSGGYIVLGLGLLVVAAWGYKMAVHLL